MGTQELTWIRQKQREFEETFGKRLVVDLSAMSLGMSKFRQLAKSVVSKLNITPEEYLLKLCDENDTTVESIRNSRIAKYSAEGRVLLDFCKSVFENGWNPEEAANLVNRRRSMIYHFANKVI